MRYDFVERRRGRWPVRTMCRVPRVSPGGFYGRRERPASARALRIGALAEAVRDVHGASKARYGSLRVHAELMARGVACCVNTAAKLMRPHGIAARTRRRFRRTTDSNHGLPVADNILGREPERIDVVVHWRSGTVTRDAIRRGLRTYQSLGGLARLRERISELRGDGLTADAIAEALNREGWQAARGDRFTGNGVRQFLARFCRKGVPAGVRNASDLPGPSERWLPALAEELGVKPIVVHRWRWSEWLRARRLRGENGRWMAWADAAEVGRLRRLRAFETECRGRRVPPAELTSRPSGPEETLRTTDPPNGGE